MNLQLDPRESPDDVSGVADVSLPLDLRESPEDVSGVADVPVSNVLSLLVRWPVCMQRENKSRSFVLADGSVHKQVRACRWFCAFRGGCQDHRYAFPRGEV